MTYSSDVQNTNIIENFSYTPYMIKPSTNNTLGYISYIDLLKFGEVKDFGFLPTYSSFNTWAGFISSVHAHLQNLNTRLGGVNPNPTPIPVTGVEITSLITQLTVGETGQLSYKVNPTNATNKSVTWSSSNTNYLTIDNNGQYRCNNGTSSGENVTLTVTTQDGNFTDSITILCKTQDPNPNIISVESVVVDKPGLTLVKGTSTTLTATVYPANATNKNVSWSSDSPAVTVTPYSTASTCQIYGAAVGSAIVTVTTSDGNKIATSSIEVINSTPQPTGNYWYVGAELSTSVSNIQTDSTKAGWHEISSLSGFTLNLNRTNAIEFDVQTQYYIVIPSSLHIYAADGNTIMEGQTFNPINDYSLSGHKAFQYKSAVWDVKGVIIK